MIPGTLFEKITNRNTREKREADTDVKEKNGKGKTTKEDKGERSADKIRMKKEEGDTSGPKAD